MVYMKTSLLTLLSIIIFVIGQAEPYTVSNYPLSINVKISPTSINIPSEIIEDDLCFDYYDQNTPIFYKGPMNLERQKWSKEPVALVSELEGKHSMISFKEGKGTKLKPLNSSVHGFMIHRDDQGRDFHKVVFDGDYGTETKILKSGGAGMSYYFTPDLSIQTGPSWCQDSGINRVWKWSVQFNIKVPFPEK
jgi:hypothetical protein